MWNGGSHFCGLNVSVTTPAPPLAFLRGRLLTPAFPIEVQMLIA